MQDSRPFIAEIKARGQLTIPKKIRDSSHLEEGQVVTVIPVGDSVIITPRRLTLDEARRQIKMILRDAGCSAEEVLAELKEERDLVYKEIYGEKAS